MISDISVFSREGAEVLLVPAGQSKYQHCGGLLSHHPAPGGDD